MKISYSYLDKQFSQLDEYLEDIRKLVGSGDFTLGKPVVEFEEKFAQLTGMPFAVGVGSGTDALILPLKALGVGHGDEVITAANTFWTTAGAIAMCGATPVYVDTNERYTIDVDQIEDAITPKTKAIIPV
ncbi:MAG: aminotransferase class I/II-fold pyridoxal phosphate-dependent enzyme, partial [Candidatus Omnitrophica bacterium]|nr:aminotransferase class I/II-fold pyridoxal phosphate-dependent enzyme [Candidatus Omnitrophota bacterium]